MFVLAFGSGEVGAGSEGDLSGFEDGFGEGGVSVDGVSDIVDEGVKFESKSAFADEFASLGSSEVDTEQALGVEIDDHFGQAIGCAKGHGAPGGFEREDTDLDVVSGRTGLGFGEADGSDLGIGKHHRRDDANVVSSGMSSDHFGGDFGFAVGFVCKHRLFGDVADREDVGEGGAPFDIDLDKALGGGLEADGWEIESGGVGPSSDRNKDFVCGKSEALAVFVFDDDFAGLTGLCGDGFVLEQHVDTELLATFVEQGVDLGFEAAAKKLIEHLDNGDIGAELAVRGAEFKADVSAPNHDELFGDLFEVKGFAAADHKLSVARQKGEFDGGGSRGKDSLLKVDHRRAAIQHDLDLVGSDKAGCTLHDAHTIHFLHGGDAACKAFDNAVFPRFEFGHIETWRRIDVDAHAVGVSDMFQGFSRVDQGFGGDAAFVEADSTEACAGLDEDHVFAQLSEADRTDVSARSSADHDNITSFGGIDVSYNHDLSFLEACEEVSGFSKHLRKRAHKTRSIGPVDQLVIERSAEVHAFADADLPIDDSGAIFDLVQSEDRKFGIVDDRGGKDATDRADVGDGIATTAHLFDLEGAFACALCEVADLAGKRQDIFAIRIFDHGNHETFGGVDGDPDVVIFFVEELAFLGVVACVKDRKVFEASDGGFDKEGERRQLDIALGEALFGAFDMLKKSRDIGFFDVCDMHKLLARDRHLFGDLASEESLWDALDWAVCGDLDVFCRGCRSCGRCGLDGGASRVSLCGGFDLCGDLLVNWGCVRKRDRGGAVCSGLDIFVGDAATASCTLDACDVNAHLTGDSASVGCRKDILGALCRRGGDRWGRSDRRSRSGNRSRCSCFGRCSGGLSGWCCFGCGRVVVSGGRRGSGALEFKEGDGIAYMDDLTGISFELGDDAAHRGGKFDDSLVRFETDEGLVFFDGITDFGEPFDKLAFVDPFADIRQEEGILGHIKTPSQNALL